MLQRLKETQSRLEYYLVPFSYFYDAQKKIVNFSLKTYFTELIFDLNYCQQMPVSLLYRNFVPLPFIFLEI